MSVLYSIEIERSAIEVIEPAIPARHSEHQDRWASRNDSSVMCRPTVEAIYDRKLGLKKSNMKDATYQRHASTPIGIVVMPQHVHHPR